MNECIHNGRLVAAPKISFLQKEPKTKVARFTLAVDRDYKTKNKEVITDFIDFVAYSKTADFVEKYLKKGMAVISTSASETFLTEDPDTKKNSKKVMFRLKTIRFPKGNAKKQEIMDGFLPIEQPKEHKE